MNRYYPTLKEIIYNALMIIHEHPSIQNPIVNYPIPNSDGSFDPVGIDKYRTYAGKEFIEPGLTISIFPKYGAGTDTYNAFSNSNAATFNPYTIGGKDSHGSMYEAVYRLVVLLTYQEVAINNEIQKIYVKDRLNNIGEFRDRLREQTNDPFVEEKRMSLEINPAEEILRDYLEVIRLILESIDYYAPWSIRSSSIVSFDFPTTSWTKDNTSVYFHEASMNWELYTYAPTNMNTPHLVRNIDIYKNI